MSKKRQAKRKAKAKARRRAARDGWRPALTPSITEEELLARIQDAGIRRYLRLLAHAPELLALDKDTPTEVIKDVKRAVLDPPPLSPSELGLLQELDASPRWARA